MSDQGVTSTGSGYQQLPDIDFRLNQQQFAGNKQSEAHLYYQPKLQQLEPRHPLISNKNSNNQGAGTVSSSSYCVVDQGDDLPGVNNTVVGNCGFIPNRFLRASRRQMVTIPPLAKQIESSPPPAYECVNGLHQVAMNHQQPLSGPIYSVSSRQRGSNQRLNRPNVGYQHQIAATASSSRLVSEVSFATQPPQLIGQDNDDNGASGNKCFSGRRKKVVQYFKKLSFGQASASLQRSIAWCLGWYGYFLGRYPYIVLLVGLTLGFGCASGLRHIKLAPIVDTDFNDPKSPIEHDREVMAGFNLYGCGCDGARTTTTSTTTIMTPVSEELPVVLARNERSPEEEEEIWMHPFSCAHKSNRGRHCNCHHVFLGFVMLDENHKHGFVDLDKFQKLVKIENMIWTNFSAPDYPDFTFENLCGRADNHNPKSNCGSFRVKNVDTKELRGALVFNVLPFPYFENTKIMSEVVGKVKTVTDSNGRIWASCVRVLREQFDLCHTDTPEAKAAYGVWSDALGRRLEQENKQYFEPVLGIGVRWHFMEKMTKYAEIAMINLLPKFFATIVAVALWAVAAMTGSDASLSKPWLGLIGVASTMLANGAGIGFMAYLGRDFNYACAGVPFLTLAIGLDDMFALVTGLHHTKPTDPVPVRMQHTMSEAGSAIFITFLTNLVAQSVGSRTPYKIISEFSTYSLVCMVFDFILQLTIFCPSLALFAMLESSGRNPCCCCIVMKKRKTDLYLSRKSCYLICCSRIDFDKEQKEELGGEDGEQQKSSKNGDENPEDSALLRFVRSYARFLIKTQMRYVALLLYIGYCGLAVYGVTTVGFGMKMENLAPFASPEAAFLRLTREAFTDYREVNVIFNHPKINYRDPVVQNDMEMIYRKIEHSGFFHPSPSMTRWWLRDYLEYLRENETMYHLAMNDSYQFWDILHDGYAREKNRQWLINDDVKSCGADRAVVCKSRGHVIALDLKDSSRQIATYEFANKLEVQYAKYDLLLFMGDFGEIEMKRNTVYISAYYVLVTVASAGGVAVIFVPHIVLIFWVVAVLLSEIIGLVGLLPFIGIDLDLVSLTMLIINVGYVVDFIMHLSFDFMMAPGNNRQDKVIHALTDVGHALIPAGAGTVMSVLAMSTTGMYVYEVYFRSLSLAVAISAIHSCFFLPVFLSFFGPLGDSEIITALSEVDSEAQRTRRPLVNLMASVNNNCHDDSAAGQSSRHQTAPRRRSSSSKIFRQPVGSGHGAISRNVVYLAQGEKEEDGDGEQGKNILSPKTAKWTPPQKASKQEAANNNIGMENDGFADEDSEEEREESEHDDDDQNNNRGFTTINEDEPAQEFSRRPTNRRSFYREISPESREESRYCYSTYRRRTHSNDYHRHRHDRGHHHRRKSPTENSPFDSFNIVEIVYGHKNDSDRAKGERRYRSSRYNSQEVSAPSSIERSNRSSNPYHHSSSSSAQKSRQPALAAKKVASRRKKLSHEDDHNNRRYN